jgi:RecG-like helicase
MSEKLSVKRRIIKISNLLRVGKEGKNTFSNYDYFKPDDILKNLNPLLEEYQLVTPFNLKLSGDHYTAILTIEDTESDEKVVYEFDIEKAEVKGANKAQNSGATLTYAKRYSLMNAFNIADNDDDFDSNKNTPKGTNNPSKKNAKSIKERTADMLNVFDTELQITKSQIEKYINKKIDNINDADISKLSTVYAEIKNGKKKKEEIFK